MAIIFISIDFQRLEQLFGALGKAEGDLVVCSGLCTFDFQARGDKACR